MKDISVGYFKKLLSEVDNQTPCVARVSIALGVLCVCGLAIAHFLLEHKFDAQGLGVGLSAMYAGGGAMLFGKKDKETQS